jgi:hypothetical protein
MSEQASEELTRSRRRGDWTPRFLEVLRVSGNVRLAAASAGIERDTAYKRRRRDERFAAAWAGAQEDAVDGLEAEARRRAFAGSDALLMFLLRAHRPVIFRERVDLRLDVRAKAERLATGLDGVSAEELIAEAERMDREGHR